MKKILIFSMMLSAVQFVNAQDKTVQDLKAEAASKTIGKDPKDTIPKTWKTGGLFNFNFGQTSLSNWAAGGDNLQLNINGFLNLHAFYAKNRSAWDNNLDLALGYVKTTSLGSRKSDDRIDLTSKFGYKTSPTSKWYMSALFNFRTQMAPGYNYPTATSSYLISQFMAPGYVLLSLGMDFKPNDNFSLFLSPITSRWVIVNATGLDTTHPNDKGGQYGVPLGNSSVNQIGAYMSATYKKEIVKNITYLGKLDLFSNYKKNPENINVFMTNVLSANIFKGISVSLGLDVIYDDNTRNLGADHASRRTQLRQYIGIGYMKKF
jgi:hypothetical protein